MKRLHVYYSGSVQGVGFRFTVERIALDLGIAGWVKNLRDGRVEVVGEADEKVLRELLGGISDYFKKYITDTDIAFSSATGEFKDFAIKF
ncbi:MAG: acylphosphatase [Candidatus Omnitrophica bacterium CG11_big_fil_rev_8_21_14_0_20_42_13]|uniref:acylphosphatase n=1 Tax=Candidatus Ghiorseimicrobium undicola TaxID=1974746 RepID=A0A2H0LV56_9BACT|nr:MAG: acylphosphatase [Candidatus Omnitrophica bacterium CG11_big_fil_rev_8_21_14_0_20_42_13]